jgi:chaperonin GroES
MTLKPLFDKVVIKQEELKETSPGGIILTGTAKEKPVMATVIAVGPGGLVDGKEIKMEVKVGDKILYSKYAGTEFKLPTETVTIIRQSDILAIIEE